MESLKKHKVFYIILVIILIAAVPAGIILLFSEFFEETVSVSDILGYYAGALSFGGTIVLSLLALHQNEVMKQQEDAHRKMLEEQQEKHQLKMEEQEKRRNQPKFDIKYSNGQRDNSKIQFELTNISHNYASNVFFDVLKIEKDNEVIWPSAGEIMHLNVAAVSQPAEKNRGELNFGCALAKGAKITGSLSYTDIYGEEHTLPVMGITDEPGVEFIVRAENR